MNKIETIEATIKKCTNCGLCTTRTLAVAGKGHTSATIMCIGEAPGSMEDKTGEPFMGASGKFLDELVCSIKLNRKDIYITNLVKCRPPKNRDPKPDEIEACHEYLMEQIKIINPKLIILLGRHAMNAFIPQCRKISEIHGQLTDGITVGGVKRLYLPLYHPAFALYNGKYREVLKSDFSKIPKFLKNTK